MTIHRNALKRFITPLGSAVLLLAMLVLLAPGQAQACYCECYFSSDCGFLSTCKYNGCIRRRVNGKLKDGRCSFLGLFSVAELPSAGTALDLWLQAYEAAGGSGGGPPDPTLVASAQAVPLSREQHDVIREVAISVQEAYLGLTYYSDPEVHRIGFFTSPEVAVGNSCDDPFSLNDNGTVEALDQTHLGVGQLIRDAMVGELNNPDDGYFESVMARIAIDYPEYRTYSRCEYPHPDHGHEFPFPDGLSCLTEELGRTLGSMTAMTGGATPAGPSSHPERP